MKKVLSFILAIVIISSLWIPCSAAETAPQAQWLKVPFVTSYSKTAENKLMIKWDWNDLLKNAVTTSADSDLAVAGMILSNQAEVARAYVEYDLKLLGFTDVLSDYYNSDTEHKNGLSNPARTFAHREINVNGETKHIICAVFRGTTSDADSSTDAKSLKDGFLDAGKNCTESLKQYQASISGATKENTILFLTGHSLGASMSSLVALLCDDVAEKSATHTYSMATPNYDTMGLKTEDYQNVHHYINVRDAVPGMPANFSKVGDEIVYDYSTLSDAERARFERVYLFFREISYEKDVKRMHEILGEIREHLGFTYVSLMLSKMTDEDVDSYIAPYELVKYTPELVSVKQNGKSSAKVQSAACTLCQKPVYEFAVNKNGKLETTASTKNEATLKKLSDGKNSVKVRVVKTLNGVEYSSPWSSEQAVKIDNTPYNIKSYKPVIKNVKKSGNKITVKAAKCKLCKKPTYQFSIKKNGKWKNKKTTSNSITFKKLAKKTYKVRVRIVKKISGKTYYSKWSANKSVKIKK